MSLDLAALCFAARDPVGLAHFWAAVLGWGPGSIRGDGVQLVPLDDTGFDLRFLPSEEEKVGQNRMHLDLTSTSLADQQQTVAQALDLGGRHVDVGQRPEEPHVVLADPEGNEFCVIEPDNAFLADCGTIGAVACEGSQEVGYFWSEALGWPLVWDQDQETAIRSPRGGPKITWSGPPLRPQEGRNRLHFDVVPRGAGDLRREIDRLAVLGAVPVEGGRDRGDRVVLTDPDGNEFRVNDLR